jgi:hypothetical protein
MSFSAPNGSVLPTSSSASPRAGLESPSGFLCIKYDKKILLRLAKINKHLINWCMRTYDSGHCLSNRFNFLSIFHKEEEITTSQAFYLYWLCFVKLL